MKFAYIAGAIALAFSSHLYANISLTGNSNNLTKTTTTQSATNIIPASTARADATTLRVLLTNDDGCKSPGILVLKEKLEKKGFDVWLSAPATNQSGIGTAITFKPGKAFPIEKIDDKSYCFPGTPSDALDFGLVGILKDNPPDLVISGVNDGPNTGMAQVNSGTVGAAIRAIRHGYPAIAASIGLIPSELSQGLPSTKKYWPDSIEYVANMVDELAQKWKQDPQQSILPVGTGISINYPPIAKNKIKGVKYIGNEFNPPAQFFYKLNNNGTATQVLNPVIMAPSTKDSDTGWLDQGFITYTVLDANWNGPESEKAYQRLLTSDLINK